MRWKVPSSNTGSDDSASAAAERDSGVLAGFTAACGDLAATGGLGATDGFGGVPKPCASACPAASATITPAIEMVRIKSASPAPLPYGYGGISTSCRSVFCRLCDSIGSKSFHCQPKWGISDSYHSIRHILAGPQTARRVPHVDDFDDAVSHIDPVENLEPVPLYDLRANAANACCLGCLGIPANEFNRRINRRENVDRALWTAFT